MAMPLSDAEANNISGAIGEPGHMPSEVVGPMHASTFMMRNLGGPGLLANHEQIGR